MGGIFQFFVHYVSRKRIWPVVAKARPGPAAGGQS